MLVGINDRNIGVDARILEPDINREASNYFINNYSNLLGVIRSCGIKEEKANDLLHDVYISIVDSENNGNSFDMEFGSKMCEDGTVDFNIMSVEQFIIGRIKLYAKNTKYQTEIMESSSDYVVENATYYVTEIDEHGQEVLGKDGKVKKTKKTEKKKVSKTITTSAASFNDGGDVTENNDSLQKSYATAATADSTDDVVNSESIRKQIDYCIDICKPSNINIVNIFKNIEFLAEMLGDSSNRKRTPEDIFKPISDIAKDNFTFESTLTDILSFSSKHKTQFESVIANY